MHESCTKTLQLLLETDVFCDCANYGFFAGLVAALCISLFGDGLIFLIRFLIKKFKAKKKPHSQA